MDPEFRSMLSTPSVRNVERQIITQVDTSLCSGESGKTEILLDSNLEGLYELIFRDPAGKRHPRGDLTLSPKLNP